MSDSAVGVQPRLRGANDGCRSGAEFVGKNVLTSRDDEVLVPLEKADGIDRVIATERED